MLPQDKQIDETLSVIQLTQAYYKEAEDARRKRKRLNEQNRDIFMGIRDFSDKIAGQSREVLPKSATAIEQFSAFVKRSLTQFGDYFSVEARGPLSSEAIVRLLRTQLDNLPVSNTEDVPFSSQVGDGVKVASTDAYMIFKVYGCYHQKKKHFDKDGVPKKTEETTWRLHVDLVRPEDYLDDPSNAGLFEIHEVERDYHDVLAKSGTLEEVKSGKKMYLKSALPDIPKWAPKPDKRQQQDKGTDVNPSKYRRKIHIREVWGKVINADGQVTDDNALWAVANEKYLIRPPIPNPNWHGESPFVKIPILRVPFSTFHRALMDSASQLNIALEDLFNLMVDGGISSVWGMKQLRQDWIDNAEEISDGIPQGWTALVNSSCPPNAKVLEQVTEGQVPQDALAMYNLIDREFNSAALTNDIKMGLLPMKQVKATEIVESQQSTSVIMDSISSDIERGLSQVIKKAWYVLMQHADKLSVEDLGKGMSARDMIMLAQMEPSERYKSLGGSTFKVNGLSATLSRVRDFQKLMALLQFVSQSPILSQIFWKKYSGNKLLSQAMKQLNMNPENYQFDPVGDADQPEMVKQALLQEQMQKSGRQGGASIGESGIQSEVNQEMRPSEI